MSKGRHGSSSLRGRGWMPVAAILATLAPAYAQSPAPIPPGDGREVADIAGTELDVFTYRPSGCAPRLVLIVFHGVERNAGAYRRHAEPLANRSCAIVVAPKFERERFPRDLYQYGGVVQEAAGQRTVDLVPELVAWARRAVDGPSLPVVLIAHSAGAQFLDRVAAFVPGEGGASGIILANPSTWVEPSLETAAPFGLGGTEAGTEAGLRAYLAAPVAVLLGAEDTGSQHLATSPEAMAQGPNRKSRGLAAFNAARATAQQHGWPFGWTLIEVPGVGHDAAAMFASPQAAEAVTRAAAGR